VSKKSKQKKATTTTALFSKASLTSPYKADEGDKSRFAGLTYVAYAGIGLVAGLAVAFNGFGAMWVPPDANRQWILFILRIVLFVELVTLSIRWIIATAAEFDLWLRWLDNPVQKQEVYGAIFGLSVFLGICVAFPHRALFITAFMSASWLFNYWTQWLANDHFARALRRTRQSGVIDDAKRQVLLIFERYWLVRPQLARIVTLMFLGLVSFALALAGSVVAEPARSAWHVAAYTLLILDIFGGELIIARWRLERNQQMATLLDEAPA
jgi:hypothetical protein